MEIWTAFVIGFFGSFHCIGMCGPIALALPGGGGPIPAVVTGRVFYNLGRIATYSLLGAFFGLVGHSVALAGLQQVLSVALGTLIIGSVVFKNRGLRIVKEKTGAGTFLNRLKHMIGAQFKKRGMSTLFTIGILNGLLPCGFVYVGLAGSLTTGSIWEGSLFMMLFGTGTFPAMFAMSLAPGVISAGFRERVRRLIPVLAILFGLFLMYRGLMMGGGH